MNPRRLRRRRTRAASTGTSEHTPSRHGLTTRESEILFWLARGKSNAEIAKILAIKPATVSKHLEHIYPKLGVENRTAAASFAFTGSHLNI